MTGRRTHGMSKTPIYKVWASMLTRCRNPTQYGYAHYSKYGIDVCERWEDFEAFFSDMGGGYAPGLTLERKNTFKGYSPDNCCWVPRPEQMRNRRDGLWADTPYGKILLKDLELIYPVTYYTLRQRVRRGLRWPELVE